MPSPEIIFRATSNSPFSLFSSFCFISSANSVVVFSVLTEVSQVVVDEVEEFTEVSQNVVLDVEE